MRYDFGGEVYLVRGRFVERGGGVVDCRKRSTRESELHNRTYFDTRYNDAVIFIHRFNDYYYYYCYSYYNIFLITGVHRRLY